MKKRLISVAVGLVLLAALFYWFDTVVLNIAFALIGALAIWEGLRALEMNGPAATILFCGVHILAMFWWQYILVGLFAVFFGMFVLVMFSRKQPYTFKQGAGALVIALMVTGGFCAILAMRQLPYALTIAMSAVRPWAHDGRFMFFMALALGWLCDTFAFTFGNLFGKRKVVPHISPNKTLAGFVGGLICTPFAIMGLFWLYAAKGPALSIFGGEPGWARLLFFGLMGLLGAAVGIIGDLAASFIKRECGIKDFGNLMPGHGGALDRLDSILFTSMFACGMFVLYFRIFGGMFPHFFIF